MTQEGSPAEVAFSVVYHEGRGTVNGTWNPGRRGVATGTALDLSASLSCELEVLRLRASRSPEECCAAVWWSCVRKSVALLRDHQGRRAISEQESCVL